MPVGMKSLAHRKAHLRPPSLLLLRRAAAVRWRRRLPQRIKRFAAGIRLAKLLHPTSEFSVEKVTRLELRDNFRSGKPWMGDSVDAVAVMQQDAVLLLCQFMAALPGTADQVSVHNRQTFRVH